MTKSPQVDAFDTHVHSLVEPGMLPVIAIDGKVSWIPPTDYHRLRDAIGGPFDFARGEGASGCYVGDESLLTAELFNYVASWIIGRPVWGTAVMAANDVGDDGETRPPTKEAAYLAVAYGMMWNHLWRQAADLGQCPAAPSNEATVPPATITPIPPGWFGEDS